MSWPTVRAACVVLAYGLAGCGGTSDDSTDSSLGSLYVTIIRHLDIPTTDDPDAPDERTVVHVADLNAEPLSLDDQITVINQLDAEYDVRFVDQFETAIEFTDDDTVVPPPDGPLVAIATPKEENGVVVVRVEMTGSDGEIDAWQLRLRTVDVDNNVDRVVESTDIEPELLVPTATP